MIMRLVLTIAQFCWLVVAFPSSPSLAQDQIRPFQIRVGGFLHDPLSPEKGSVDGNLELLGPHLPISLSKAFQSLIPRPHIGATLNTANKTSEAYVGLSWGVSLTEHIFAEASFGGAANNGKVGATPLPGHNALGCVGSFRESGSLGYKISSTLTIMTTVEHISNAGLCSRNRGLTNGGIRIGYSF